MAASETSDFSSEGLKSAAAESVAGGADIRERVRDLTLAALQRRRLDPESVREVLHAMGEGITVGADRRAGDVRQAASEAFRGLDEALQKAAEAGHLALRQLTSSGRDFSENELRQSLANLRRMEEDFGATLRQLSGAAGEKLKPELREFLEHAQRSGTDTGLKVAQVMSEFAHRVTSSYIDTRVSGLDAARELSARFSQAASGFLAGLAEGLRKKPGSGGESR